jgi:hypothetical protein
MTLQAAGRDTSLPYPYLSYGFPYENDSQLDDTVMAEPKREAARQGRTMSELVAAPTAPLSTKAGQIPALPTFRSGGTLVEIADRDALYQATEGRILLAVDTNVLVYAADADSQFYRPSTTARVRARAKR